jgi:hypothetical protein
MGQDDFAERLIGSIRRDRAAHIIAPLLRILRWFQVRFSRNLN